jgi:hypothetical protein
MAPAEDSPNGPEHETERVPTVTCTACEREWELHYELEELKVGNRALEQFALDHHRHTGHYPDDVTPWVVACDQCPATEQYLEERPARRFAIAHARHTNHTVSILDPNSEDEQQIRPESVSAGADTDTESSN